MLNCFYCSLLFPSQIESVMSAMVKLRKMCSHVLTARSEVFWARLTNHYGLTQEIAWSCRSTTRLTSMAQQVKTWHRCVGQNVNRHFATVHLLNISLFPSDLDSFQSKIKAEWPLMNAGQQTERILTLEMEYIKTFNRETC